MPQSPDDLIATQPAQVRRGLTIDRDGNRQHTVQSISQSYPTTVEDLWQACTAPERLARWFAPVSGELRPGGRYQVEGNASGTIVACDPPRSFTVTWELGGDSSQLTVHVAAEQDAARLTIEHEHSGATDSPFWAQFGPGATGVGWDLALLGLVLHLGAGQDRPDDPGAFVRTAPAQRFVRAASEHWAEASIRAGTPRDDAYAAARRTTGFYLGEQPEA